MKRHLLPLLALALPFAGAFAQIRPLNIVWSEPQDGLSLGIQVPAAPLGFTPVKDWKGPLTIREEKNGIVTVRNNPGGSWSKSAAFRVYVRNTGDATLSWASDDEVWRVKLSGNNAPTPEPWTGSIPMAEHNGPVRLHPGTQCELVLRVDHELAIWPPVPEGKYTLQVTYSPDRLLAFERGSPDGRGVRPYDVPGFWKGEISTPPITITVAHE